MDNYSRLKQAARKGGFKPRTRARFLKEVSHTTARLTLLPTPARLNVDEIYAPWRYCLVHYVRLAAPGADASLLRHMLSGFGTSRERVALYVTPHGATLFYHVRDLLCICTRVGIL